MSQLHRAGMLWSDLTAVFLLGLAGTGHCAGMCGAFGIAVSGGSRGTGSLAVRHLAYQIGKGASYAFLGILLLLVLGWLASEAPVLQLQRTIGWIAGGVMIVSGVLMLLERRLPARLGLWWNGNAACRGLSALWQSPSVARNVLIGWINGFLPCGLSLTAMLFLSRNGSALTTLAGAFVFALGTMPGLLAVGWLGQRFSVQARRRWIRFSGVVLIVLGVLTLLRDHPAVHSMFHPLVIETPGFGSHEHQH
jgi:uncharacterized protein